MARKKKSGVSDGNIMARAFNGAVRFLGEVKAELAKVAWPSRDEVIASTWVVLAAVGVVGLWIFAADKASSLMMTALVSLFS
jgi:preprotein translocase SecE subunit